MVAFSMFDSDGYREASTTEVATMLDELHYLGAAKRGRAFVQFNAGEMVACMVWAKPTSRHLPQDGTWLELTRWCLTPQAGENAGSRMHRAWVKHIKAASPEVLMLVSYSDPSVGHTGSLYRACNWRWAPTWQRLRPPPSGGGSWDGITQQAVKDRWVFPLRRDDRAGQLLMVRDQALNPDMRPWADKMQGVA